jgi:hypothetical protein
MPEFAPGRRWFMTPAFLPKPRRGLSQERELRQVAERAGWEIVHVYKDYGISGAKGRDKRPAFDALHQENSNFGREATRTNNGPDSISRRGLRIAPKSSPEPTLHSNAWAAISAREIPLSLGIFGVCSIPCDLPYGLCHDVIFGPAQVGGVA